MDNPIDEECIKNIANIYSLNGNNKESWDSFLLDINSEKPNEKIIIYLKNKLTEEQNNHLNLDIIDYIIDKSKSIFVEKIFDHDFFDVFINKTVETINENKEIKEKSLFLIKKWYEAFIDKYKLLSDTYNKYKDEGIIFPEKKYITYDKYIQENINNDNIKEQINELSNKDNLSNEKKEENIIHDEKTENADDNVVEKDNNIFENNTNFNALDNPFEENYDNLLENIDFPEDDKYQNKFSNLRTSEIPMYFKTLRSKSIVESTQNLQKTNQNSNDNPVTNNNNNNLDKEKSEETQNSNNKVTKNSTNNEKKENITNMNNLFNNSNNNISSTFINYKSNPLLFQNKWKEKISLINKWIKEGKNSNNFVNLKEGIKQLLIALDEIEEIIIKCATIGDNEGRDKVSCIKSDMEQTCYRYECLIQGKKVEKFKSSFDGNVKRYYFYKSGLLQDKNIKIDDIEEEKKEKKIKIFGKIKNGFLKVGKKIKSKSKDKNDKKDKKEKKEDKKEKKEKKMKGLDNIGILDDENEDEK